jgi:ribosomal protein S18 acetylase RimI-like enzyme
MSTPTSLALPVAPAGRGITYRRWTGFDELPGMAAANARLRARCGMLEPVDLDAMRHVYTHLVNSDPLTDCIVARRDGATVGYGRAEWHDLTDGDRLFAFTSVVEPAAWGQGITEALVPWCEDRLREIAAGIPDDRRAWLGTYVFDGDTELERVLLTRGYEAVRWDAEMIRDTMDDLPEVPPLPDGYEIRPVPPARLPDVGAMLIEAFRDHWGETEESDDEIRDWLENPRFDIGLVTVVWHGDAPAACAGSQVQDHADGGTIGYVDVVATAPGHRRLGLARTALADSLHRLADRGMTRSYIGVDTDNGQRAFALYEDAGFRKFSGSTSYRMPLTGQETRR